MILLLAGVALQLAAAPCPAFGGAFVGAGEDGYVELDIKQFGCDSLTVKRRTRVYDGSDSARYVVRIATPKVASGSVLFAQFRGDTLQLQSHGRGRWFLNAQQDLCMLDPTIMGGIVLWGSVRAHENLRAALNASETESDDVIRKRCGSGSGARHNGG